MANVMMSNAINTGVAQMLNEHAEACVRKLATKFEFDIEEALKELSLEKTKVVKEKPSKKTKDDSKEAPKKEKKAKKEKDPNKPKRAPTGYLLFSADLRPEVKDELTEALDEDEKLKPQDVVRVLADRWKALEQNERDEWNQRAKDAASGSSSNGSAEEDED